MATAKDKLRSMAVPYQLLLNRVEDSIKLRKLLSELLFMALYAIFFLVFVALQAQTQSVYEVNSALEETFQFKAFPGSIGQGLTFDMITSKSDWFSWFDNVALPTISLTKYPSSIGISTAPTQLPTHSPSNSPTRPTIPTKHPSHSPTISHPSTSPTLSPESSAVNQTLEPTGSPEIATPQETAYPSLPEGRRILQATATPVTSSPTLTNLPSLDYRSKTLTYFGVVWQKRVKNVTGDGCVQAPNFLWNSLQMFNAAPGTPAIRSDLPSHPLCYPAYSTNAEETDPSFFPDLFKYYAQSPVDAAPYVGTLMTTYPSNGYYSARINGSSFASIWPSLEQSFIDSGTRLLAVTVVTYNPTYNTWSSMALVTEILESGTVRTSADPVTGPLMYCSSSLGQPCTNDPAEMIMASITAVFIILHLIILIVIRRSVALYRIIFKSGIRGKGEVLRAWLLDILNFWVALDIAQFALGIITLVYIANVYWSRSRYNELVMIPLDAMTNDNVATVNSYLNEYIYMQQIFGSQIILFNIQVFKYFPALPCFVYVRLGWYNAYLETIKVFIMYWVLILLYAFVSWIAYGQFYVGFASFDAATNGVIRMILGEASFDTLKMQSPQFTWAYLVFFIIFFVYLLQALFLSVVIEGFRRAFNSYDVRQSSNPSFRDVFKRMARNDYAMSSEYAARLKAWKAQKANKNATEISWSQLRAALRGQVHNRMDITDETVDDVFRLVKGVELRSTSPAKDNEEKTTVLKSPAANESVFLMPQLLKTMFEVKADERNLMKHLGGLMKQMRKSQTEAEALLHKADAASTRFAKDE